MDDAMAENRTHNLSIDSLMAILHGTSHHQQKRAVDTVILLMLLFT